MWYVWLGLRQAPAGLGGYSVLGSVCTAKFGVVLLFLCIIIFIMAGLLAVKAEALLDALFS